MFGKDLKIYYINLDRATERRASMEEQIQRLGLEVTRVPATSVENLDPEMNAWYDVELRRREYSYDLRPAEHACLQSHMRTLKMFLESDASYAIVLEDDSELTEKFVEGVKYLLERTSGWEIVRLQSDLRKYDTLLGPRKGAPCELVLPRKPLCASTALMYNRRGAERLVKAFHHYATAFDTHMGRTALLEGIPLCATLPNLVELGPELNAISSIGDRASMKREHRNSLRQYLNHRLMVARLSARKKAMKRLMRRVLRIGDSSILPED